MARGGAGARIPHTSHPGRQGDPQAEKRLQSPGRRFGVGFSCLDSTALGSTAAVKRGNDGPNTQSCLGCLSRHHHRLRTPSFSEKIAASIFHTSFPSEFF